MVPMGTSSLKPSLRRNSCPSPPTSTDTTTLPFPTSACDTHLSDPVGRPYPPSASGVSLVLGGVWPPRSGHWLEERGQGGAPEAWLRLQFRVWPHFWGHPSSETVPPLSAPSPSPFSSCIWPLSQQPFFLGPLPSVPLPPPLPHHLKQNGVFGSGNGWVEPGGTDNEMISHATYHFARFCACAKT